MNTKTIKSKLDKLSVTHTPKYKVGDRVESIDLGVGTIIDMAKFINWRDIINYEDKTHLGGTMKDFLTEVEISIKEEGIQLTSENMYVYFDTYPYPVDYYFYVIKTDEPYDWGNVDIAIVTSDDLKLLS